MFIMRTAKTLIRLGGYLGWPESSLGAHVILLFLSFGGSYHVAWNPLSAQRRLWSDLADSQTDLSIRWAHISFFFGFVVWRLIYRSLVHPDLSWVFRRESSSPARVWRKTSVFVVFLFGFNVVFNNFSVISRRCLVATGSSMLTFIVLLHRSIMPQTLDMISHPVTLTWHWVDQS